MKKLFLTLLVFIAVQLTSFAAEIKFVQVTDVHFTSKNEYAKDVLKNAVNDINKLSGVSFVAFTGDNIDSPDIEYLKDFIKIANKLKVPYYVVIGNHDVYKTGGLSKEKYIETIKWNHLTYGPRKPNYVFKKNGFAFIVVDGAKEVIPGPVGYYKKDTLDWLDKQLSCHKNDPVVILQHFPLVEPKKLTSHKTYQAENYLEMLNKHDNVAAVISGHYHSNGETMKDGIYHISSPSLLNDPPSYKIITVVATRKFSPMIYTELKAVNMNK